MSEGDMLRAAAHVLRRTSAMCTCERALAWADVLIYEAGWAEADPDYARRPEPPALAAARMVLAGGPASP